MNSPFFAVALALGAAACWGAGDFSGGLASRRSEPFRSVLIIYSIGLVTLGIVAYARRDPVPPLPDLIWGAVAGLLGMVGILLLFRAFTEGRMGIAAPVSGVLATALPVVFNAVTAGLPGALKVAGFALAMISIWVLSRPERLGGRPAGLGIAIAAGICFGSFFITLNQVSKASMFWPLITGRAASITTLLAFAVLTKRPIPLRGQPWVLFLVAGVLDVFGNIFFLQAIKNGRLDVASVLGSLYPAVTALLAWTAIREKMTRVQVLGVGTALAAIVLITLPGG